MPANWPLAFGPVAVGLAQADAVDDGGVVQRVADDRVLVVQQRLEDPGVRVEPDQEKYPAHCHSDLGDHFRQPRVNTAKHLSKIRKDPNETGSKFWI